MLRHLSFLNAKRQIQDYLIYFVTLLFAILLLYGFNSLLFSPEMAPLMTAQLSGVRPLIYFVSIIIVGILGWLVNYMLKFMLTRRGRELGTYMLMGISNRQISWMIFLENGLLGLGALVLGIPCGVLFSEVIKAVTMVILGQSYSFGLSLSHQGMLLTIAYVWLIFLVALVLNQRQLKRLTLKELIYLQASVKQAPVMSNKRQLISFAVALLGLAVGIYCFAQRPFANAYDILLGLFGCTLFIVLFFEGLSGTVVFWIETHSAWLFQRHHLILYRTFAAKMKQLKRTLQSLGILFLLTLCSLTLAAGFSKIAEKRQEFVSFDVVILHQGAAATMRKYDPLLEKVAEIQTSHSYNLYHTQQQDFSTIRDQENGKYQSRNMNFKESNYDTYLKLSDYQMLRKMLGLKPIKMGNHSYVIHCLDYLKPELSKYGKANSLKLNHRKLELAAVQSEPFNQYQDYGNGYGFILVVPDDVVEDTSVLYSLYTAQMSGAANQTRLSRIIDETPKLSTFLDGSGTMTAVDESLLITEDDYVFGRKMEKEGSDGIPMILPLVLLGVIFCITGATILAVQLLSDRRGISQQERLLDYLGEDRSVRRKILKDQLLLYFIVPLLPALVAGNAIAWIMLLEISRGSFRIPILAAKEWALEVLPLVNLVFLVIYFFYGLVVYRQLRNHLDK